MPGLSAAMDDLERRFVAWAEARDDIRAAIVVGSRARTDHPADDWADLDVAFVTTKPARYHRNQAWLGEIASVWTMYKDPSGLTYHVLFEGGLDAGIAVMPERTVKLATRFVPALRRVPLVGTKVESVVADAAEYYRRGVRVLFDKDGTAAKFLSRFRAVPRADSPPTAAEFEATTREFWFAAVWTAKHLFRGELWFARSAGTEGRMRDMLLPMIEWHTKATRGPGYDTWERGRFIEEWAEPWVLEGLKASSAPYDLDAVLMSLEAMMALFSRLSVETAKALRYVTSDKLGATIQDWIREHRPAV